MIIVRLLGGIGNQMFRYSLGRTLSVLNDSELKLDVTPFENDNIRTYELGQFNIRENFATNAEIEEIAGKIGLLKRCFMRLNINSNNKYIRERSFAFDSKILDLRGDLYLDGYWQTEKYFNNIAPLIRKEFSLKRSLDNRNREIVDEMKTSNSVSMHVRRGDYITKKRTVFLSGGVCTLDYYYNAVKLIESLVKKPVFYIFSDDIQWTMQNIMLEHPTFYIDWNLGKNSYKDIVLMSLCKHNIIANSTFSWWGAWLNEHEGKIVISPSRWFNYKLKDYKDVIPRDWKRIGV